MTRARVTAQQLTRPPKSARLMRGTVSAVSPLTVQIAGGGAVGGIPIPGATYTVGGLVLVLVQEPGVGPVYPIPGTTAVNPSAVTGYLPTSTLSGLPLIGDLNSAPDGFAAAQSGATNNPLAATVLVETYTSTLGGAGTWRFQRASHESSGEMRIRRLWAGAWSGWGDGSTTATVANAGTVTNWGTGMNGLTRQGQLVTLRYAVNVGATPPSAGSTLGTIPTGFRPAASLFLIAILWNGWNNNRAEMQIEPDGRIIIQSASGPYPASSGVFLNATYSVV